MNKGKLAEYKKCIKGLLEYMHKNGCKVKPYPRFIFNETNQGDKLKINTGFYNPEDRSVTIFVHGRGFKDCMRSIAHELIHHMQNLEGRLGAGTYEGQEIIKDNRLQKLEEEAYLKGNILFRRYTEEID